MYSLRTDGHSPVPLSSRILDSKSSEPSTGQPQDTGSPLGSIPATSKSTQSHLPDSTLDIPSPAQQADDAMSKVTQSRPPDSTLAIPSSAQRADELPNAMSEATQSHPPDSTLVIPSPAREADELPVVTSEATQSHPPDLMLVIPSPAQQADGPSPDEIPSGDIAEESYPCLIDSHPCREQWPSWMSHAVSRLEEYTNSVKWRQLLLLWLDFEDKLGYPYGQVS
jgi:hypothetical protein